MTNRKYNKSQVKRSEKPTSNQTYKTKRFHNR